MKKRLLAFVLCVLLAATALPLTAAAETAVLFASSGGSSHFLDINAANFPDESLRSYIIREHHAKWDSKTRSYYMTEEQVKAATVFDIKLSFFIPLHLGPITDFKGIEHFTELRVLSCYTDGLTKVSLKNLDLRNNTKLEELSVREYLLSSLDLTRNTALKKICIFGDWLELESLELGRKPNLTYLELRHHQFNGWASITRLDASQCPALETLLCERLMLNWVDLSKCTALKDVTLNDCRLSKLDLTRSKKLEKLVCCDNVITDLRLGEKPAMTHLNVNRNRLTELDVSGYTKLTQLSCAWNRMTELDVSKNTRLTLLDCRGNEFETLDLKKNAALKTLYCDQNRLTELDLSKNTKLDNPMVNWQEIYSAEPFQESGSQYTFDLGALVADPSKISVDVERNQVFVDDYDYTCSYDKSTGILTASKAVGKIAYLYDTGRGKMEVQVMVGPGPEIGRIDLAKTNLDYKGTTPYMVYDGAEKAPAFAVYGKDGWLISPVYYEYSYTDNVLPGTAKLVVKMKGSNKTMSAWFKIYLPATTTTTVQNVQNGIQISWKKVNGAKGYVIYRRAWNLVDKGWTTFERWNNTTKTTWTDTKVYAGTRYQYGIKAYFKDPMDNYNLGIVGPLKTTVRITTRTLSSVTPGSKSLTAKWAGSKLFTGYQVQIATDAAFKSGLKTVTVGNAKTYQQTIKGLKSMTTYYVRIRSYHVFDGTTYYGQWSNVLSCKVK